MLAAATSEEGKYVAGTVERLDQPRTVVWLTRPAPRSMAVYLREDPDQSEIDVRVWL